MGEDDIRKYLSSHPSGVKAPTPGPVKMMPRRARPPAAKPQQSFKNFSATHLFCPRCRKAMPVRERILLFLSDGDLYDYNCTTCGTSVGTRKAGRDS